MSQLPDEGLGVEFYWGSGLDREAMKLETAKRRAENPQAPESPPIFKDVPWVRILIPGNKDEIYDSEAWLDPDNINSHINRFPVAWARFKARDSEGVSGFPLKDWAVVNRSVSDTLAANNIRTVEQLSALTDGNIQRIPLPNMFELRAKAQDFIQQRQSTEAVRAELETLKAQLRALQQSAPSEPMVKVVPETATAQVLAQMGNMQLAQQLQGQVMAAAQANTLAQMGTQPHTASPAVVEEEPAKPRRRGRPAKKVATAP